MTERSVEHEYHDPLDLIWLKAAARVGMTVVRSDEVFASWDGKGTLTICSEAQYDPDDCLAQMIFHEMCHALVQFDRHDQVDWGLSNEDERDLVREHACHRLQAKLAQPFGLRDFMAVTTQWRPYWDALPDDPLAADDDPATPLAERAFRHAKQAPWDDALRDALSATAQLADLVRPLAGRDSLWTRTRGRHRVGFLLHRSDDKVCGECAWIFEQRGTTRCRRSKTSEQTAQRTEASARACEHWQLAFDETECGRCGACCRQGFDAVVVRPREAFRREHPELVKKSSLGHHLPRPEGRCVALDGDGADGRSYRCRFYLERPRSCADFPVSGDSCLLARRRVGLSS